MSDDLSELIARVEALEDADRAIDWELHVLNGLWGVGNYGSHPAYTASLDAALALVERVLPGRARFLLSRATTDVYHDTAPDLVPRLARNLILALLRALAVKEKDREE